MKKLVNGLLICALLACSAGISSPVLAQDGPIRQRLKERWLKKAQQEAAPEANAEVNMSITQPGDYLFKMQHGGGTRMYRVHVPAKYDPATPAPVLFAFHGGGGSMDVQANDKAYGHISKSEREGVAMVFPNGTSRFQSGKLATWNAGRCCGGARDNQVDDVGFIRKIVSHLVQKMNIDRKRIYATGMSNGGMMSYRLACEMSDVFAGIAAVAGTDNTNACTPAKPISILHIHAKDDRMVLFTGGAGPDSRQSSLVTDFTSVPDTVKKWVRLNGCASTPRRTLQNEGAWCDVYESCKAGVRVQLCVTETGGHAWPGGFKARTGEAGSMAISANDVMREFFNRQ